MTGYCSNHIIEEDIPEGAVFVIGAGHFGTRAARLIRQKSDVPIFVADLDENRVSHLATLDVNWIECDGIQLLLKNYRSLDPSTIIVPAVPFHLAYEWLTRYVDGTYEVQKISVPEEIKPRLPHSWPGSEGSLLVSYADFVCPDDCPEPDFCTVTGERREQALYDLLRHLDLPGFHVHVIRSHQIAPGLGGYTVADLTGVAGELKKREMGKWLLGTACKCHGILTAFKIRKSV